MHTIMNIGNSAAVVDDFAVEIESSAERIFVRFEDRSYDFTVPFSREEVESALDTDSPRSVSTQGLSSLGSTLFSALFSGDLGRAFWQRMSDVERLDRGLRLRILSNAERTQHLPWELMFDPSRGDFMALSGRIALVRTRPEGYKADEPVAALSRLRILVAEADPTNGSMRNGEDIATLESVKERSGLLDLTILRGATLASLSETLQRGTFDVFHFAGTGEVLPHVSKKGGVRQALRLIGPTSSEALLGRQDLGRMLRTAGVRLAVLNACRSDWIARSVAKYIPAVIGFREDLEVESCLLMCRSLYESLVKSRMPIDLAVTAARQAMNLAARPGVADWCKLIFYLQQRDGTFLAPTEPSRQSAPSPAAPQRSKEYTKLARLLDVHEANLDALTKSASSGAMNAPSDYVTTLQRKIEEIKRQLGEAERSHG